MAKQLKITLTKSPIGVAPKQKVTVATLGLKKTHKTVVMPNNAAIRGMVWRVKHLVRIGEIEE